MTCRCQKCLTEPLNPFSMLHSFTNKDLRRRLLDVWTNPSNAMIVRIIKEKGNFIDIDSKKLFEATLVLLESEIIQDD